jgi:hypothetical protein
VRDLARLKQVLGAGMRGGGPDKISGVLILAFKDFGHRLLSCGIINNRYIFLCLKSF